MTALTVAIQMDAIESLKFATDSSLLLGLETQRRGHRLYYYQPHELSFTGGKVTARARRTTLRNDPKDYYTCGEPQTLNLSEVDVVLLRQDPPFDMAYITTTLILETLMPKTLVVNDPFHVRNAPEKWIPTLLPQFCPPTLISADREALLAFRAEHREIILKPLYGYAGHGVFHLPKEDKNFHAFLDLYFQHNREPLIAQRFIPDVTEGDRRIILIDGKIAAFMGRVPAPGEIRANFRTGGTGAKADLSKRQRECCEALGPEMKKRGLLFAGVDMIGDYLIEVNVTSPTGLPAANRINGLSLERDIWDAIEAKLEA